MTRLYNGEKLRFTVRYELARLPTFRASNADDTEKKNPRQISKILAVNDLGECCLDSAFPTRRLPRGMGFMHDLIPTQVLLPSIRLQATGSCVPCDEADMILY